MFQVLAERGSFSEPFHSNSSAIRVSEMKGGPASVGLLFFFDNSRSQDRQIQIPAFQTAAAGVFCRAIAGKGPVVKPMTLSTFAIVLGVLAAIPQVWAILKPLEFGAAIRKFPRSEGWGYLLMAVGSIWFLANLNREAIAEFAAYKTYMLLGFGGVAVAACFFVPDYLAVRGMSITMLMLASYTLSLTRWAESPWRLVLVVAAYIWVVLAMWWMVSPWRVRDLIQWATASPQRLRTIAGVRLAFAAVLIVLGATVYK
jgi:hypothetical protein